MWENILRTPHIDKAYAARALARGEELFEDYLSYAPVPKFVQQCFSPTRVVPEPSRTRAWGLRMRKALPSSGLWPSYCHRFVLKNKTFGHIVAPVVDKVGVKELVAQMNISGLIIDSSSPGHWPSSPLRTRPPAYESSLPTRSTKSWLTTKSSSRSGTGVVSSCRQGARSCDASRRAFIRSGRM